MLTSIAIVGTIVALIDIALALVSFRKKTHESFYLGMAFSFAAAVDLFYIGSVYASGNFFLMSLFSSAYFVSVTLTCLMLTSFIAYMTESHRQRHNIILARVVAPLVALDIVSIMSNPFTGAALGYFYAEDTIAHWRYDPHALYIAHLIIAYMLIVLAIINLVITLRSVPRVYRHLYTVTLAAILIVVAMNAVFLFLPAAELFDFSVFFYSVAGFTIYWTRYHHSPRQLITASACLAMEELSSAVILFDHKGRLLNCNSQASTFIPAERQNDRYMLFEFVEECGFSATAYVPNENCRFDWITVTNGTHTSYQCSSQVLRDKKNRLIGQLFTITDNSFEVDLLTGFHSKTAFEHTFTNPDAAPIQAPAVVAACDINGLARLNDEFGRRAGDEALRHVTHTLRRVFPPNTYFARSEDATLIVVCPEKDREIVRAYMEEVRGNLAESDKRYLASLSLQYALSSVIPGERTFLSAASIAISSMKSRKLLDASSSHFSLLSSLAQAQSQNDGQTEEHVARTRTSGELLGKRLGLSDMQQSSLALLCLLHDIGKIGVPLEVLNKPSKLTPDEWEVMKSHSVKGYEIAHASSELSGIARLILHHHERWDGKGYPAGLAGENIPLLSRIIAVVDTYDAMTHDRPYRKALSSAEAKEEMRRCAGTQFDPMLVDEFLMVLEQNPQLAHSDEDDRMSQRAIDEPAASTVEKREPNFIADSLAVAPPIHVKHGRYYLNEDNRIIRVDEGFTNISGYSQEDIEAEPIGQFDLIFPDDYESYRSILVADLEKMGEAFFQHRLRCKDGSARYVLCYGRVYFDPVARAMRSEVILTDITH